MPLKKELVFRILERCAACGAPAGEWGEGAASTAFDPARFEALKGGRADA